ncbi:Triosephosphate isomerase [Pontivivens insulae]|uniref:Triosephosphate isomerase n=1 Tax=Pontivivens insulae TaxID=1639689 RepID=A0A2R8AAD4_9RHOB|nr:triosephosphate isomerase [Pontivivens insulae]SPF29055.1 Triosephosphate isomerase [Pontivivens insulae]
MSDIRPLIAGNWKMNGSRAAMAEVSALAAAHPAPGCDVMLCPPAPLLPIMVEAASGTKIAVGAQDCHANVSGAHTGDTSATLIAELGATAVIVGHSERRADHGETDAAIAAKAAAAHQAGLIAIICIGETEAERDAGRALEVARSQLAGSLPAGATAANTVIAYEPVWAIGTGKVASVADIDEVHSALRTALADLMSAEDAAATRLLYGGSVKPGNAAEIFAVTDVNGALVGGASLKAADFGGIIAAAE